MGCSDTFCPKLFSALTRKCDFWSMFFPCSKLIVNFQSSQGAPDWAPVLLHQMKCRLIPLNIHPKPTKRVKGHLFIINLFKFTKAACFLLGRGKSPLQAVLTFQQGLPQPLPGPHICRHITAAHHSRSKHRSLSNRPVISLIVKKTSYSKISSTFIAYHTKNYLTIFTITWKKKEKKKNTLCLSATGLHSGHERLTRFH